MGVAVLSVLLASIWTWAPLLSAVLQSKLLLQLPPDFTVEGPQQNEPKVGPVLQRKLQPLMPPGVKVYPEDVMKLHQLWQSYIHKNPTNDQQRAQSPSSAYRWQPRERHSQQESPGMQNSGRTQDGVGSGGCPYCRGVHSSQPTRTNAPTASEQHPPRFQPWWSKQDSQVAPVNKPSQNPKFPQGWVFNRQTGQQKPGQPSGSPSKTQEAAPLSSNAYLFKPQGFQRGSGTSGPRQGVDQSGQTKPKEFAIPVNSKYYPGQFHHKEQKRPTSNTPKQRPSLTPDQKQFIFHSRYQDRLLSYDSPPEDVATPQHQKPNIGYQAWGSNKPGYQSGKSEINEPSSGWQSSYSSGRQVGNEQSSNKPSQPKTAGSSGQQRPYSQPNKSNFPPKSSRNSTPIPPSGYYLRPNLASQSSPHSKPQNEGKHSQWLSVRPPKQAMPPNQSKKPPSGGSAKFYNLPSRLIEENALSKKDSQDGKAPQNPAVWHRQQGFSKPKQQSYGPDNDRPITMPPLGSDVVVSGSMFFRGRQNVGFSHNSRFSQTNEKQQGSLSKEPAANIYQQPYIQQSGRLR